MGGGGPGRERSEPHDPHGRPQTTVPIRAVNWARRLRTARFRVAGAPVVYLPSRSETRALFAEIDSYEDPERPYMAAGYRVAFRLMRLCGLRLAECANMAADDVRASSAALLVRHSKGAKDRLVYMSEDVACMDVSHMARTRDVLGFAPDWLFPGRDPSKHIYKTTFDKKFAQFWDRVPGATSRNARPTPHSLRHAFVVERMNDWMSRGVSLPQMMPYPAAYLGQDGANETFYYYHQVEEAFSIVRERDAVSARVIPEAVTYEVGPRRRVLVRHGRPPRGVGADPAYAQLGHALPHAVPRHAAEAACVRGVARELGADLSEAEAPAARLPHLEDRALEDGPRVRAPGLALSHL